MAAIFATAFTPLDLFAYTSTTTLVVATTTPAIVLEETLPEMADRIAIAHGIPSSTLRNLIQSESTWNPTARSKTGDVGIVQINLDSWDVTEEEALDPEFAMNFAAGKIKSGQEHYWVACNCYLLVKAKIGAALPKMRDIQPNSTPHAGAVAIFWYRDKDTGAWVKHVAYVKKVVDAGFYVQESNFVDDCVIGSRFIKWDDPRLDGFFDPAANAS